MHASSTPTTVIPTKVGIHASFSECNRHRESKALTEQEPIFFTGFFVGMTGIEGYHLLFRHSRGGGNPGHIASQVRSCVVGHPRRAVAAAYGCVASRSSARAERKPSTAMAKALIMTVDATPIVASPRP